MAAVTGAVVVVLGAAVVLGLARILLTRPLGLGAGEGVELAVVEEDAAARVALLDVHAVALVGTHGTGALGAVHLVSSQSVIRRHAASRARSTSSRGRSASSATAAP